MPYLICGQGYLSRFAPLPLQICDQEDGSRGIRQYDTYIFVPDYKKRRGKWQFCSELGKQKGYNKTFFLLSDFFIRSYTIFRTVQRLKKKQNQKDARTLKTKLNSK